MRSLSLFFFLTFAFASATCAQEREPARVEAKYQCEVRALEVKLKMYLDYPPNGYVLSWDGLEMPELKEKCELWVMVFDQGKPGDYYKSLSTPMTFSHVNTSSDSVELSFSLGDMFNQYDCQCYFERIKVPVGNWDSTIILMQDRDWYFYKYLGMDEFEEALVNRSKYQSKTTALNLRFDYVDLNSGKIKSGKKWDRSGNVYKVSRKWQLVPIYPYQNYQLNDGSKISGSELIDQGKVDPNLLEGVEKQFYLKKFAP